MSTHQPARRLTVAGIVSEARELVDQARSKAEAEDPLLLPQLHQLAVLRSTIAALDDGDGPALNIVDDGTHDPAELNRRLVRTLGRLAAALRAEDRLSDAERVAVQTLAMAEGGLGPAEIEVADLLRELGILFQETGRYSDAEASYRRALTVVEHSLGRGHREALAILHNLALLCDATDRTDEARALRSEAKAGVGSSLGDRRGSS